MGDLRLEFDKKMYDDLVVELTNAMVEIADYLVQLIKTYSSSPELAGTFRYEIMEQTTEQIIIAVGSDHWQSFIENYGMGSLMAKEHQNPFLAEYKRNFFHPYRWSNNAVTARALGHYTTPDWESGDGYIRRLADGRIPAGTNLETNYSWKNYTVKVRPKSPKFFMEQAFDVFETMFASRVQEIWNNFPWDKYIQGGR